ncbi:MAG: azurin [Pseudomonadota bacterium]
MFRHLYAMLGSWNRTNMLLASSVRRRLLLLGILAPAALAACKPSAPAAAFKYVDLSIETDGDLLEFKQKELSCISGAHVRLTFHHTGRYVNFEHNWVLILPGTFDVVTAAALAAGEERGWLPHGDKRIIAATPMCGKGQVATVEFVAPIAGDYPFICSFPGHAQSMWGVLHVTVA